MGRLQASCPDKHPDKAQDTQVRDHVLRMNDCQEEAEEHVKTHITVTPNPGGKKKRNKHHTPAHHQVTLCQRKRQQPVTDHDGTAEGVHHDTADLER
ncbi:hypothetical protein NDU88_008233 [Pleurodeles waltl]|uniref:Uncharacterized protein n=1 Tax=Pleurodeles waltl TaxID=8319 RepID=A0AAV7QU30_PLEWA|nr:hypothetical protein NDU88_008233 [Pleurodeles waltl]